MTVVWLDTPGERAFLERQRRAHPLRARRLVVPRTGRGGRVREFSSVTEFGAFRAALGRAARSAVRSREAPIPPAPRGPGCSPSAGRAVSVPPPIPTSVGPSGSP